MSTAEKKRINVEFRKASGLIIDQPKQGGDTSNDGNAARRFFENAKESAEIIGVSEQLIRRMHTILAVLSSGFSIDVEKFREYTFETAKLYVELYKWYPMPSTVYEVLLHGGDIINAFELPIGRGDRQSAVTLLQNEIFYQQDSVHQVQVQVHQRGQGGGRRGVSGRGWQEQRRGHGGAGRAGRAAREQAQA
ncbi:unnamed protein product [Bemisia tabaci]|uniref:Uncharacterized protein n=1 Tax=Bemisia tabaci TaxID=7038 RepID=A0A9P0F395_BEMTA|nr:unnamed protein product [Bemisia tabaci]